MLAIISSDSMLDRTWAGLRARRRTGLVPYLTAGFPDLGASRDAIRSAAQYADVLEVGVPFSDPLADGPTIQASTFQSLANGMTLPKTLELISSAELTVPVVLFTYLNPVLQYGVERLVRDAAQLGIAGILLTDLPAGADSVVESAIENSPLDLIRLIAPTTVAARLERAVAGAEGFLYLIARLGVTGVSDSVATGLAESVQRVRAASSLPVAVGFGVSNAAQACAVAEHADGVVIGSALVDILAREGVAGADTFLAGIRTALDARS